MRWADIWILYRRELRSALRERTIVMNGFLIPLLLYPLIMWIGVSGMTFVQGLSSRSESRIALVDLPPAHAAIRDSLEANSRIHLLPLGSATEAEAQIRAGGLDAALVFLPAASDAALQENVRVRLLYDAAEDAGRVAFGRASEVVDDYRASWIERTARDRGASDVELTQFRIRSENQVPEGQMGAFLLGLIVPMMLCLMVAIGCLIPSVDSTAGERERSTWETLMTVAAPRNAVMAAKYFYVATIGVIAGLLNVFAFTASMGIILAPLMSPEQAENFGIDFPWMAIPVMMAGAVVLALFFSAAMMILASFARTFKEGQTMAIPAYWLALLPVLAGQDPDNRLDLTTALIPIVNVTQMIRDAIQGVFAWDLIAISLAEAVLLVAGCIWLAARILSFEDHLMGSFDGSFWKFTRERLLPGRRTSAGGEA